jgi:hypothetical protein
MQSAVIDLVARHTLVGRQMVCISTVCVSFLYRSCGHAE